MRSVKHVPVGAKGLTLKQHIEHTLGTGAVEDAVRLPPGEELNEWLAVNTGERGHRNECRVEGLLCGEERRDSAAAHRLPCPGACIASPLPLSPLLLAVLMALVPPMLPPMRRNICPGPRPSPPPVPLDPQDWGPVHVDWAGLGPNSHLILQTQPFFSAQTTHSHK